MMKARFVLGLVVAIAAVAVGHEGDEGRQKRLWPSRCYPGSHCYPNQEEIEKFKDHIVGQVFVPSDTGYPSVVASTNLRWTRNPGIVVVASTTDDVIRTVLFAREYYLNLVWSASGVDYSGKGFYDGSLRLDLSNLKSISTSGDLQFQQVTGGTVTASVGSTWGEIYAAIEGFGRSIAGGSVSLESVAAFTLNGGLGPYSRTLGLASDALISTQMVLANGLLATVSSAGVTVTDADGQLKTYDDTDLFRAIRGGGVTWGVPISFTYSLNQAPLQYASLTGTYRIVDDGAVVGRSYLSTILTEMYNLPVQWGGYISIDGSPSTSFPNDRGEMKYHLFSYGSYDFNFNQLNNINTAIERLRNIVNLNGQGPTTSTPFSLSQYRNDVAETEQHFTDKPNSYVFNALLGSDVITNTTKRDLLVELMMDTVDSPTVSSNWRCVAKLAGGKVSSPNTVTYVNSRLRDALFSWTCALTWDDGPTREDYYIQKALIFQKRLRALGNGGVDPYYASEDMEDWRAALYGDSYYELLNIKKRWDVDNYLWAHNAVASDFELNCNGVRCPHHH